jgi:hypothetical protein
MAKLFTHVGQAPNSRDCGFFCGYVVSLHKAHGGNLLQMRLSRQDVYAFRDDYLGSTQTPRVPGHRWLLPDQMPSFLSSVGVSGATVTPPKTKLQSFIEDVDAKLARPKCWGALIAFEGATLEHWVAILQSTPSPDGRKWVLYDPAGNINKVKDLYADRFYAHQLVEMWLERHRIRSIVA